MLQALRRQAANWAIKGLLVLVALTFVLWGTSSIFNLFLDEEMIVRVNDEKITTYYYQNIINSERERLQTNLPIGQSWDGVDEKVLQGTVLSQIINRTLIKQAAIKDKITLNQKQIDQIIVNQVYFHKDGKFDEQRYISSLRGAGFSPQGYKEYIRENFQYDSYLAAMRGAAFYTPDMLNQFIDWQYQKRGYSYVQISPASFIIEANVSEQQLRVFYEENIDDYYEPEYFRIRTITITPDDALAKINYGETDIRNTYNDLYGYFYDAEEIALRHIFFESPDESDTASMLQAEELKERIRTKEDFIRLVVNYTEDDLTKDDGGNLGVAPASELPPEFVEAIRTAPAETSLFGPLRTPFGVHLLWLDNRSGVDAPAFEDVYDELVLDYLYGQLDEQLLAEAESLSDELFISSDLAAAANTTGYKAVISELVSLNSAYIQELGNEFIDELLVLQAGETSPVIWLENGNFMAFQLLDYIPNRLITYDEIEEKLREDYLLAQAEDRLGSLLSNLAVELNRGMTKAEVLNQLTEEEMTWQEGEEVSRANTINDEIGGYILSLQVSAAPYASYTQLVDENYVLVFLDEIIHQDYDDLDADERITAKEKYLQEIRSNAQQWLLTNLNEKADIIFNTQVLDNL